MNTPWPKEGPDLDVKLRFDMFLIFEACQADCHAVLLTGANCREYY